MRLYYKYTRGGSFIATRATTAISQTAKTMLLRALITTAELWILAMTAAVGYVTFRN
jgi:hypothetical protein